MTINRYRGNNLRTAISKARAELGPEARVIHVRQLDGYSAPGAKSSDPDEERIEIIVATDGEENTEPWKDPEASAEHAMKEIHNAVPGVQDTAPIHQERIQAPNITPTSKLKSWLNF